MEIVYNNETNGTVFLLLTSNTAARRSDRTVRLSASSLSAKSAEQHCYASPEVTSYKSYQQNAGVLRFHHPASRCKYHHRSVTKGHLKVRNLALALAVLRGQVKNSAEFQLTVCVQPLSQSEQRKVVT